MSINSKKKGAKGERELANKLKEYGYNCRRGRQYNRTRRRRCSWFRLYTHRMQKSTSFKYR